MDKELYKFHMCFGSSNICSLLLYVIPSKFREWEFEIKNTLKYSSHNDHVLIVDELTCDIY